MRKSVRHDDGVSEGLRDDGWLHLVIEPTQRQSTRDHDVPSALLSPQEVKGVACGAELGDPHMEDEVIRVARRAMEA